MQLIFRSEGIGNELDQDVAAAYKSRPDDVRDQLLQAIRHVELRQSDILLLQIESKFRSALKAPWKESKNLKIILEACRQGKIDSHTEGLFYQHGKTYAVIALAIASKPDPRIFYDIESLAYEDKVKLVCNITTNPQRATITEFIEDFDNAPRTFVSDNPPLLPRPRSRKKGPEEESSYTSHEKQSLEQEYKKRRLGAHGDLGPPTSHTPSDQNQSILVYPHRGNLVQENPEWGVTKQFLIGRSLVYNSIEQNPTG